MKKIYLIRDAKAEGFSQGISDFEREITKKGKKDILTIGSYMALRGISLDIILSSCALRAQQSAISLAEKLSFSGEQHFLQELYFGSNDALLEIVKAQDDKFENLAIVGHNPQLNELINRLTDEHINKIPAMGVVSLSFDIESWSDIDESVGKMEFFIYPKQFKYYMPKQIQATLLR
jgi:phosphohistidine phosphatase